METAFDREELKYIYPWLINDNMTDKIVIGDDLDSILSACFWSTFVSTECEIVGFYSKYTEIFANKDSKDKLKSAIWLDLDIAQTDIKSIGHHILREKLSDQHPALRSGINTNELRGIDLHNFSQKYPLATVHFLMYLFDKEIPDNPLAPELIFLADSAWILGQSHKYQKNVEDWLFNYIPVESLVKVFGQIDTIEFEKSMQKLFNLLTSRNINQGTGQSSSRHLQLSGFQFQFTPNDPDYLQLIFEVVCEITGWQQPRIAYDNMISLKTGVRSGGLISDVVNENYDSLDDFIEKNSVFSYVFPFMKHINYTTGIDLV